jgi:hypothetical protein
VSPLLNYTTTVSVGKTMAYVQNLLVKGGARQIMATYDDKGAPTGVHFTVTTVNGLRAFTLPVHPDSVLRVMRKDPKTPARYCTPEQAERVAWRIVKDWLEAQLAIIDTEMVAFDEVMLPYMHVGEGNSTVYQMYAANQLPALGVAEVVDV